MKLSEIFDSNSSGSAIGFTSPTIMLADINGTVSDLFTLKGSFDIFIPTALILVTTVYSGVMGSTPVFSVGSNATNYNNLIDQRTVSNSQATLMGFTAISFDNGIGYALDGSVDLKFKLNVGESSGNHRAKIILTGVGVHTA